MNYVFYDYETSGTEKMQDQVLQYGAIHTDSNLNIVGDPINILCKPRFDVLPSPGAYNTTRLDVEQLEREGFGDYEFIKKIHASLAGNGNQYVTGYNTKEFDNKFTQFLFYRNMIDPYAWGWDNGNKKVDIYDLCKFMFGLRQNISSVIWPERGGKFSLKLELLAEANGFALNAHDALDDVRVTIFAAKMFKECSPSAYQHFLNMSNKDFVDDTISKNDRFVNVSSFAGVVNNFLTVNSYIDRNASDAHGLITWNLNIDPTAVLNASIEDIKKNMYAKKEVKEFDVGFVQIKRNQSPMVHANVDYIQDLVDIDKIDRNKEILDNNEELFKEIGQEVFKLGNFGGDHVDVEEDLYGKTFFKDKGEEKWNIQSFHRSPNSEIRWRTERFAELHKRWKWRNCPEILNSEELGEMAQYANRVFRGQTNTKARSYAQYLEDLKVTKVKECKEEDQKVAINKLEAYVEKMLDNTGQGDDIRRLEVI